MPDNLLTLFPTPEALLAQEPEDLAGAILEVVPGASQNGMFNYGGLMEPLFPAVSHTGYPPRMQSEVQRALTEAVQWLMNQDLVIRDPEQPGEWYSWWRLTGLVSANEMAQACCCCQKPLTPPRSLPLAECTRATARLRGQRLVIEVAAPNGQSCLANL
jgi:hypothetical protein